MKMVTLEKKNDIFIKILEEGLDEIAKTQSG
jgi:hypothetical protein